MSTFFAQFCRVPEFCRVQYSRHTSNRGSLPCAKGLPCASFFSTRQTHMFAVCCAFAVCFLGGHTANKIIAVSWTFAVCCFFWHTAKVRFAVCPCFSTRQRFCHTVICEFPVVHVISRCILNTINLEKPKQLTFWNRESRKADPFREFGGLNMHFESVGPNWHSGTSSGICGASYSNRNIQSEEKCYKKTLVKLGLAPHIF